MNYKSSILFLTAAVASLHLAHWSADTRSNEHKALGDLYDTLNGLTDDLAETALGRLGDRTFPPADAGPLVRPYRDLIPVILAEVNTLIDTATADRAQDILNIAADMQAALNRAKYFLSI